MIPKRDVARLIIPSLQILRAVEIDLANHPCCPYRQKARQAVDSLMDLLQMTVSEYGNAGNKPERIL